MIARLNVNIDHVATVRQARRAVEPSVIAAAMTCEQAGADGITIHLRGDRRHIQDDDLTLLRRIVTTHLNVEMAATDEMVRIALDARPHTVTLVAENPHEITTEGGLNADANREALSECVKRLRGGDIAVSLFVDPDPVQIEAARELGAQQIELCTAAYSEATAKPFYTHAESARHAAQELRRLRESAVLGVQYGLRVAAGHGLTYRNVSALAAIEEITEFNIGHNIVARAVLVGLDQAVREMRDRIR